MEVMINFTCICAMSLNSELFFKVPWKVVFCVIAGNLYLQLLENVNSTLKYVLLLKVFVRLKLKLPDFILEFFLMSIAYEKTPRFSLNCKL